MWEISFWARDDWSTKYFLNLFLIQIIMTKMSLFLNLFFYILKTLWLIYPINDKDVIVKKGEVKIGNNLRFDKIKENLKHGEEIIKKEWKNLKKFLED